jgi:hypothetical protein
MATLEINAQSRSTTTVDAERSNLNLFILIFVSIFVGASLNLAVMGGIGYLFFGWNRLLDWAFWSFLIGAIPGILAVVLDGLISVWFQRILRSEYVRNLKWNRRMNRAVKKAMDEVWK